MGTAVLVVEADADRRFQIGGWLEDAGFEVLACPGPRGPHYRCIASDGARCPLADAADVIVLDMRLESDRAMQGTPGWELLSYYVEHGEPVVALSGEPDSFHPTPDQQVAVLRRPPDRGSLVDAVRRLARAGRKGEPRGDDLAD